RHLACTCIRRRAPEARESVRDSQRGEMMAAVGGKAAIERRDFLKIGSASAALGATTELAAGGASSATSMGPATSTPAPAELAPETKYPKLAIITPYSPQKLAFATATGYEGVVIPLGDFFDPDKLTDSQT